MKTRTVFIIVQQRMGSRQYERYATIKKQKTENAFYSFEIQSDMTVENLNEVYGAVYSTNHPELIDWEKIFFPISPGYLEKGLEEARKIELSESNWREWIEELNRISCPWFGEKWGSYVGKDTWLESYEGATPEDCLREELIASQ